MGDLFRRFEKDFFPQAALCRERSCLLDLRAMLAAVIGIDPFLYVYPTGTDAGRRDEESGDRDFEVQIKTEKKDEMDS